VTSRASDTRLWLIKRVHVFSKQNKQTQKRRKYLEGPGAVEETLRMQKDNGQNTVKIASKIFIRFSEK